MTSHERSPTWESEHDGDASAPEEGETERRSPSSPVGSRCSRRRRLGAPGASTGVLALFAATVSLTAFGVDVPSASAAPSISETSSA